MFYVSDSVEGSHKHACNNTKPLTSSRGTGVILDSYKLWMSTAECPNSNSKITQKHINQSPCEAESLCPPSIHALVMVSAQLVRRLCPEPLPPNSDDWKLNTCYMGRGKPISNKNGDEERTTMWLWWMQSSTISPRDSSVYVPRPYIPQCNVKT